MFFVLLRADRYAGILEADGGFELFPINGPPQLQRFPHLLFAGCRYARRRSSASKGKPAIITAPPTMITSVVLGGIKPRTNVKRPKASRNTP